MNNILRDEVNQHTSDEVAKVLEELESQGVDLTAIKEAMADSGGSYIKSIQKGTGSAYGTGNITINIESIDADKAFVILNGVGYQYSSHSRADSIRLVSLSDDEMVISLSSGRESSATVNFSYQIIEFA